MINYSLAWLRQQAVLLTISYYISFIITTPKSNYLVS